MGEVWGLGLGGVGVINTQYCLCACPNTYPCLSCLIWKILKFTHSNVRVRTDILVFHTYVRGSIEGSNSSGILERSGTRKPSTLLCTFRYRFSVRVPKMSYNIFFFDTKNRQRHFSNQPAHHLTINPKTTTIRTTTTTTASKSTSTSSACLLALLWCGWMQVYACEFRTRKKKRKEN